MVVEPDGRGGAPNGIKRSDGAGGGRHHHLNFGEEDQMEIEGYAASDAKRCATWLGYLLSLGLVRLVFHWFPQWMLFATHSPCGLDKAEKVLIIDKYKNKFKTYFVKDVETLKSGGRDGSGTISGLGHKKGHEEKLTVYLSDGSKKSVSEVRIVRCKKLMYVWDEERCKFIKLSGLDNGVNNAEFFTYQGHKREEQQLKRIIYGANEINVPVQSILTLLVLEALTPFYIFQVFSLTVWFLEGYYYYTIAIIIMSVFGISTSIIQTRKNQRNLRGTVHSADKVLTARGGDVFEEIPTAELVPGDVIAIPSHGCDMHCDAVLLNGTCIVNESMLTGESVPVSKTALPNRRKPYDIKEHGNHTLFCGTRVIQTRYYSDEKVLAVVIRTGYLTSKGELVRSILYPPPTDFKFDQDSYKFILILTVIAMMGFIYTIFSKYSRNIAAFDIVIKALDLITIAIPPALPAAMTVGKLYALNRLKKYKIFCVNSRVINVSGSVNCICFDKTGTLTEDGLDMWGVVPMENSRIEGPLKDVRTLDSNSRLFTGMLTCHSLTLVDDELCGDPLDVKMFEATGWVLEEPTIADTSKYDLLVPTIIKENSREENAVEIGLIQQYHFSSTLQRMSVVCKRLGSEDFEIYAKGSPEMIMSLSKPETIPEGITETLKEYTEKGYRVIGMGAKRIADVPFHRIPKMHREEAERDLEFVGLIVLENRLKPQTAAVIETLKNAGMKIVMVTGDNAQTAVSVARDCGIIRPGYSVIDVETTKPSKSQLAQVKYIEAGAAIPVARPAEDVEKAAERKYHLVLTGNTWADINKYFPDLVPKICTKGVVFARMSGHQKQQLVEELKSLGYYVAMCGDGANDCGALKAANVGISLSEAESSVASPFTSREANIACTKEVVREGRAALVTSFGVFKLMLCYSLTEFASCIILYAIDSNLTSFQFLFIDICLILNFASFFGKTRAYEGLHHVPPMTSLLSFVPLASITLFMLMVVLVQVFSYYFVQTFPWFTPYVFNPQESKQYKCFENYAVYCVSMFQYIIMAVVFSKGKPYRKAIYTNYIFSLSILLMVIVCAYITLEPASWIEDLLELQVPPQYDGRIAVLITAAVNFVLCIFIEDAIVEYLLLKFVDKSRETYLKIERDLREDQSWPDASFRRVREKSARTEVTRC